MNYPLRNLIHIISSLLIVSSLLLSCGGRQLHNSSDSDASSSEPAPWDLLDENQEPPRSQPEPEPDPDSSSLPDSTGSLPAEPAEVPQLPDSLLEAQKNHMSRYNRVGRLNEVFNDSNKYQYAAAERIGINPVYSFADAYYLKRPLVEIASCQWYDLDPLTHSAPFLVPEAANLLETIGRNFADSLSRRHAKGLKFRVTSVLRTGNSVKRLRRVNRNATDSSTHKFATTFDISYAKFNRAPGAPDISDEELKYILAEVLYDLRRQQRCMVKYEIKSPCFHITATGR